VPWIVHVFSQDLVHDIFVPDGDIVLNKKMVMYMDPSCLIFYLYKANPTLSRKPNGEANSDKKLSN
jgi:hypothetical protein